MKLRGFAAALFLLLAASGSATAQERILRFVSDVTVERNGDLDVTETIRVQAQGQQIRRGILRDFPTTYTRPDGSRVVVGFSVQSVSRDGAPEAWVTESMTNGVRVRIGKADVQLSNGQHEYVIHYVTTRQVGFFADRDELYWNATGTGWTFTIDLVEARITLPERVSFLQSAFYTGAQGASGRDASVTQQQPGQIVFRTTRPLPPGNGLTVSAAWPKGVIAPPSWSQQAGWWVEDNLPVVIALFGLPLVLGYYVFAWLKVGRDPPSGTIIPLFSPPDGMSAAAVRYVEHLGFDDRCFTAAIIDLGVNGHIKLTSEGKQTTIAHKSGGKPIAEPEQAVVTRLFAGGQELLLTQDNYKPLGSAKTGLSNGLTALYGAGQLFSNNFLWSSFGCFLIILFVAAIVFSIAAVYDNDSTAIMIAGTLVPLLPIMGGAAMIHSGSQRDSWGAALMVGGSLLIALSLLVGFGILLAGTRGFVDMLPATAAYIVAPLASLGFRWLQAPTVKGRGIMDRIEGFRQYLGVAEEDRLNALNPPDKTPELFERFLPYAIALDVENRWAKRFAGVLAAAGAGAVASAWYAGNQNWSSNPTGFADHLSGSLSQTIASASTAPGSSDSGGSSGGGFSGGGGGGGGGSGW